MLCVPIFSSISSPGRMDLQNEVLVAIRQSDHSSASVPLQAQSMCREASTTRAETFPSRGPPHDGMEVPCWRAPLELLGMPLDVCGDCSPGSAFWVWKETCN